ncbi:hypothetical protein HK101_010191 [Irineochytrium annulatum]|nr:hypothetical protein HK101_010191 [Irineochytrium annulatum]
MLLNSAVVAYKGRNSAAQRALVISTLFAILGDLLVWFNLVSWFTYPGNSPPFFSYVIVAISINKRLYSIVTAYITFLRFQALTSVEKADVWKWIYVGVYAVVSITTATLHLLCYTTQNWDRVLFRQTVLYKYIYCPSQFVTASVLFGLGLFTDLHFLFRSYRNPVINAKFLLVRAFYNIHIFVLMEAFMYLVFAFLLVWSMFNTDVTAAIYVEQLVLALMALNGAHIVRTVLITDAASYAFSSQGHSGRESDKVGYGRGMNGSYGRNSSVDGPRGGRGVVSPRRNVDIELQAGHEF